MIPYVNPFPVSPPSGISQEPALAGAEAVGPK